MESMGVVVMQQHPYFLFIVFKYFSFLFYGRPMEAIIMKGCT